MPDFVRPVETPPQILDRRRAGLATTGHLEDRAAAGTWSADLLDFEADGDGMHFRGYAAVFDQESDDLGGFREVVSRSAFDKSLSEQRAVKMFWNHDQGRPLGSTKAVEGRGLLTLKPDRRGLLSDVRLPDTSDGRDMAELVRTGIVDSMSFGFTTIRDSWSGDAHRQLDEVRIWEVSPVTGWPAYAGTSAGVRALAHAIATPVSELEEAAAALLGTGDLTPSQRELLVAAINTRSNPIVAPVLAQYRVRFAALTL